MGFKLKNKNIANRLRGNVKPSSFKFTDPEDEKKETKLSDVVTISDYIQTSPSDRHRVKKTYTPPERTLEGDAAYAALSEEEKAAQDAKWKAMNTKEEILSEERDKEIEKKLETYHNIYRKNMIDNPYDWNKLWSNWHNKARLFESRSGEDYGGDIDFDFGVDRRTAEQGGNVEGKHVKTFGGSDRDAADWYGWEKIEAGRLPYYNTSFINPENEEYQSDKERWADNIRRSYTSNLSKHAADYIKNINISNLGKIVTGQYVPINNTYQGRKLLTQEQHNEIYKSAHDKWFKNFKKAYPEITWGPRKEVKGEGSTNESWGQWKPTS